METTTNQTQENNPTEKQKRFPSYGEHLLNIDPNNETEEQLKDPIYQLKRNFAYMIDNVQQFSVNAAMQKNPSAQALFGAAVQSLQESALLAIHGATIEIHPQITAMQEAEQQRRTKESLKRGDGIPPKMPNIITKP